jgi:hypothetical protein
METLAEILHSEDVRLTVYKKDGTSLSGRYSYLSALARVDFARTLPEYAGYKITEAE